MLIRGRCHCGYIALEFETALPPAGLPLRADQCSFCRRHGARTTSDPNGHVRIGVHAPDRLIRYRFGLKITDFFVCGRCGIYVAAVMTDGDATLATLNVKAFEAPDAFARAAEPVTYDGETEAERRARRRAHWTPAVVVLGSDRG